MPHPRPRLASRHRRSLALGVAALALVALAACNPAPDKKAQNIVIVGGDTTQDLTGVIASNYNSDPKNTDPDTAYNVLSIQSTPLTVPADSQADCAATTFHTPAGVGETLAPNAGNAGVDALKASVANGDGCVSIARTGGSPRAIGSSPGTDNATFEYYGFALDAVGWASESTLAPADITLAQLRGIYNCTYTDWSQVGGTAGPIKRYWPTLSSGTRSFFQSSVLGFDPTTFSSASCPSITVIPVNSGTPIVTNADQQKAIVPFSVGNWVAQANGVTPDIRGGLTIRSLNGAAPLFLNGSTWELNSPGASGNPGAPVAESNVLLNTPTPSYPGIRYVFHVVDNTEKLYSQAVLIVGFGNAANGWKSALCSGTDAATINQYGFAPLDTSADGTHNAAGSTCRLYTP